MQSYNKQVKIGTYSVSKQLIQNIEEYFKKDVVRILSMPLEQSTDKETISVIIYDSHGQEKYHSIEDHRYGLFRDDVKGITIDFGLKTLTRELKVTLRFGKEEENCDLAISLTDENAREKVSAIEDGIFSTLNRNKNLNRFLYPPSALQGICVIGAFISGVLALDKDYSTKARVIYGSITCVAVLYFYIFRYFKSYCTFETNKQKQLDKFFSWFIMGLIGFLLFTTLLTSVRKSLFGF